MSSKTKKRLDTLFKLTNGPRASKPASKPAREESSHEEEEEPPTLAGIPMESSVNSNAKVTPRQIKRKSVDLTPAESNSNAASSSAFPLSTTQRTGQKRKLENVAKSDYHNAESCGENLGELANMVEDLAKDGKFDDGLKQIKRCIKQRENMSQNKGRDQGHTYAINSVKSLKNRYEQLKYMNLKRIELSNIRITSDGPNFTVKFGNKIINVEDQASLSRLRNSYDNTMRNSQPSSSSNVAHGLRKKNRTRKHLVKKGYRRKTLKKGHRRKTLKKR